MNIINTQDATFAEIFSRIRKRASVMDGDLWETVREIVDDVAKRGDEALFAYTEKFDGISLDARSVAVSEDELDEAASRLSEKEISDLKFAAERIERFHRKQEVPSFLISEERGIELGQRVLPLERVGIYAPGGRAVYPSTVLMAAIPARIAGVEEVVLVTPCRNKTVNPLIAAAAKIAGVGRIYKIGGAQAIAALAYGTESVPAVDKIVGPGNAYVAAAKKMVYGQVAIDMIAGPSEVLIIADGTAKAENAAADLLAQAEHDTMASALLLTPLEDLAREVDAEVEKQLPALSRSEVARRSLADFGALIVTRDMDEAASVANRFAPEHLELMVADYAEVLKKVKNAGAVFLGSSTPETLGDYVAGPNHILPTGGTARFSSPLGVYDFVKRTSILFFSPQALQECGPPAARLAALEGFDAHSRSVTIRTEGKKS